MTTAGNLDVPRIILRAFTLPWERRGEFLRALALPVALMVAVDCLIAGMVTTFSWEYGSLLLALTAISLFLAVWVAVITHRLVLLHSRDAVQYWLPAWTWRESKFAITGVLVTLICIFAAALVLAACNVIDARFGATGWTFDATDWTSALALFAAALLFTRYCLMFPEIAVSGRVNFALARLRARGQVINLFAIVGLLPFLHSLLHIRAHVDEAHWLVVAASSALVVFTVIVEVVALSLAYQHIVEQQEP